MGVLNVCLFFFNAPARSAYHITNYHRYESSVDQNCSSLHTFGAVRCNCILRTTLAQNKFNYLSGKCYNVRDAAHAKWWCGITNIQEMSGMMDSTQAIYV